MTVGLFEVASDSDDAHRRTAARMQDKIAQATYDVRERHGDWLFGAKDIQGFHDRVAMSFNSICHTIEPTLHARKGVSSRVIKNLEQEWRRRQADMPGAAPGASGSTGGGLITGPEALPGGAKPLSPDTLSDMRNNIKEWNATAARHQACYPGCEKNEAHAKKFHKDKEARRRQAEFGMDDVGGLSTLGESAGQTGLNPAASKAPGTSGDGSYRQYGPPAAQVPTKSPTGINADPVGKMTNNLGGGTSAHDPTGGVMGEPFIGPVASRRRRAAEDGAYERSQPDHPEMHIQETFQDHQGENLIPEGDFEGYKDRVDQGGPEKVDSHDFIEPQTDTGVAKSRRHDESDSDNFVPTVTGSREFQHLARFLYADDMTGNDPNAQVGGGAMGTAGAAPMPAAPAGGSAPPTTPPPAPGAGGAGLATPPPGGPPPVTASREYQAMADMLNPGRSWAIKAIRQEGTIAARQRLLEAARTAGILAPIDYKRIVRAYRNKLADRNYLQQADEALTKVLNEKAEEFQNTIAPLQQALVTIQQAEQLQNPLNVTPPAGTVNVLPQQPGGDPNAAAGGAAPAGGDPSGGMAPQGGGGLGADPAAAALAGATPPQQMQASWYTGVQTRPRQATRGRRPLVGDRRQADVDSAWNQWSQGHTNRGDDSTYEQFAQDKGYAAPDNPRARAIPSLQQGQGGSVPTTPSGGSNRGMPKKPKGAPAKPAKGPGYGIAAQRRHADLEPEPGYIWSKAPASVKGEFMNRIGAGITPEQAYRQMIAEITEHHAKGVIGSHDAHRAANEAFGRLLLSRRGRRPLGVGGR